MLISAIPISTAFGEPRTESEGHIRQEISIETLQYLKTGYSRIKDNEDGTVAVSGNTEAYQAVDAISVTLCLEVYNGATWDVVTSWVDSAYESNLVYGFHEYPVEPGETYRVRGVHEVWENRIHESGSSCTGGITIEGY